MTSKDKVWDMLPLLHNDKFVVVDIETSGLSPDKGGRIIEIGAVLIDNGNITDRFETLINPEQKISAKITDITGITNEMLIDKPVIGQVLPGFNKFMGDAVIVAHNADFDWNRFLLHFFKMVGIFPNNKLIDTLVLSKHFFPNKKKHNLNELCLELNVTNENHHRALNDAEVTAECLLKIIDKFGNAVEQVNSNKKDERFEQIGLLNNEVKEDKKVSDKNRVLKVKKVSYWEKPISKNKVYRRIYANINDGYMYGNVYFDIPTKTWYNKDFPENVDFELVNKLILNFLKLSSTDELCNYRN